MIRGKRKSSEEDELDSDNTQTKSSPNKKRRIAASPVADPKDQPNGTPGASSSASRKIVAAETLLPATALAKEKARATVDLGSDATEEEEADEGGAPQVSHVTSLCVTQSSSSNIVLALDREACKHLPPCDLLVSGEWTIPGISEEKSSGLHHQRRRGRSCRALF